MKIVTKIRTKEVSVLLKTLVNN